MSLLLQARAVHAALPFCQIHVYDGTMPAGAHWSPPPYVHFHASNFKPTSWRPWASGRAAHGNSTGAGRSRNGRGHVAGVAVLKMDCDGCEYTALPPFLDNVCVDQVLLEVHAYPPSAVPGLLARLNRTHGAFYAEPNVFGAPPGTCLELALRRRRNAGRACVGDP